MATARPEVTVERHERRKIRQRLSPLIDEVGVAQSPLIRPIEMSLSKDAVENLEHALFDGHRIIVAHRVR